jgi:hypothetical protein
MLLEKIISTKKNENRKPGNLESEKKPMVQIGTENSNSSFSGHDLEPCKNCGCTFFWKSIYGDGIFRCQDCDQPPAVRYIGERFNLLDEPRRLIQVERGDARSMIRSVAVRDATGATICAFHGLDDHEGDGEERGSQNVHARSLRAECA